LKINSIESNGRPPEVFFSLFPESWGLKDLDSVGKGVKDIVVSSIGILSHFTPQSVIFRVIVSDIYLSGAKERANTIEPLVLRYM
jgi:hypothetical protein